MAIQTKGKVKKNLNHKVPHDKPKHHSGSKTKY